MALSREQFSTQLLEHTDSLYRIAMRFTRNANRAEDLVQETYYRALRSWETFNPEAGQMRPWLVRILRNTFLSRSEREARQPKAMADEHLDLAAEAKSQPLTHASSNFTQYMDEELVQAMDALPEEYRSVLTLWALEDFSYQEIADALEIPIGTVMSRLYRARARLSQSLQEYAKKQGIVRE